MMFPWTKKHNNIGFVKRGEADTADPPPNEKVVVPLGARRVIHSLQSIPRTLSCCTSTSATASLSDSSATLPSEGKQVAESAIFQGEKHSRNSAIKVHSRNCATGNRIRRDENKLERLDERSSYDDATSLCSTIGTSCKSWTRNECGICSELIVGPRPIGACIPCGHFFHQDCFFGEWASTLLYDIKAGKNKADKPLDSKCLDATCVQCGVPVREFVSISIITSEANDAGAMGLSDGGEEGFNEFVFRKLMAKANMTSFVRQGISEPSSPKMVIQVLRVTMGRFRKSEDGSSSEVGNTAKDNFLAVGGHVAMLHAVSRYSKNQDIWGWAIAVIAELCTGYSDVLYRTTPNLAGFVASAMNMYPEDQRLQSNGCCTFSELCKSGFAKESLKDICTDGGLVAVTNAIARYSRESVSLCWNAVSFLVLAAQIDPDLVCGHVLSESEAFECLLATLKEPLTLSSPVCVRLVCTLLLIASRNEDFRAVIIKSGGVEALQAVYRASVDDDAQAEAMANMVLQGLSQQSFTSDADNCGEWTSISI